jgi:hypothetical protein
MKIDGRQAPGNENGSAAAARCAAGLRARIRTMPHSFALNNQGVFDDVEHPCRHAWTMRSPRLESVSVGLVDHAKRSGAGR